MRIEGDKDLIRGHIKAILKQEDNWRVKNILYSGKMETSHYILSRATNVKGMIEEMKKGMYRKLADALYEKNPNVEVIPANWEEEPNDTKVIFGIEYIIMKPDQLVDIILETIEKT